MSKTWPDDPGSSGSSIQFDSVDIDFQLERPEPVSEWIEALVEAKGGQLRQLQYVFCSDDYLYQLNVEHLDHETLTDIITFPYQDPPVVEGDIFISIERITDNAADLGSSFGDELHRVMIHGVLHLLGYRDKSPEEQSIMRMEEDQALERRKFT